MRTVEMIMPQMGESITEGTIITWLKKEGEAVEKDEIILEISTDKVDSEIPSPHKGIVAKLLAGEGETVQVGSVIAQIETGALVVETAPPEVDKPAPVKEPAKEMIAPAAVSLDDSIGLNMIMPQMGESITEGTIIRWIKKEGDRVKRDEIVLEISTDKVDSEIPSPHTGTIVKLLANEGDTVAVGSVIAQITPQAGMTPTAVLPVPQSFPAQVVVTQETATAISPTIATPSVVGQETNGKRRFYSPLVRTIARKEGVTAQELEAISGTGANGRVTKKDILNYLVSKQTGPVATQPAVSAVQTPPVSSDDRVEIIPMNTMRKNIATHMVASIKTSPHVFAVSEADMTNLVNYRAQNKERFLERAGTRLTYMSFITMACARALQDFPLVNSSVDGTNIIRKKYINIGVAVALENSGLIVPVIKNADNLNIVGLARVVNDLAERARARKLKPDEVQDGTFSITNMGVFGSLMGLPIINQPQVAILGVGTIQKRPMVINDAIAIRSMMYISLSFDHRIVDGALAGQFLERIASNLTNFDVISIL